MAGLVDGDGIPDLPRARSHTQYHGARCDADVLLVATVAFGLWPALRLSRPDLLSSLKDRAGEVSGKIAGRITVRDALVTTQLALSLALLVVSGLFVRRRDRGCIRESGLRCRSVGDCADRAESGWLRRGPRSRGASRPARDTALDARHRVSRGSIGPSIRRLFVRRRRTARGASAEERGSGSGQANSSQGAHLHDHVGLLQDARFDDGAGSGVYGG